MGIGIYSEASSDADYSQGDFTDPITVTADGRTGQVVERILYVHNDDSTKAFTEITVQPWDSVGDSHVDGTDGWAMKVSPGSLQPTQSGWDGHDAGVAESLGDVMLSGVAGLAIYAPFWLRTEVPREEDIQSITEIKLRLAYNETNL